MGKSFYFVGRKLGGGRRLGGEAALKDGRDDKDDTASCPGIGSKGECRSSLAAWRRGHAARGFVQLGARRGVARKGLHVGATVVANPRVGALLARPELANGHPWCLHGQSVTPRCGREEENATDIWAHDFKIKAQLSPLI